MLTLSGTGKRVGRPRLWRGPCLVCDRRSAEARGVCMSCYGVLEMLASGTRRRSPRRDLLCDELTTAGLRQLDILWPAAARGVRGYLEVSDG